MAKKNTAAKGKRPAGKAAPKSERPAKTGKSVAAAKGKKRTEGKASAKKVTRPPAKEKKIVTKAAKAKKIVPKGNVKATVKKSTTKPTGSAKAVKAVKKTVATKPTRPTKAGKVAAKKAAIKKAPISKVEAKKATPQRPVAKKAPVGKVAAKPVGVAPKSAVKKPTLAPVKAAAPAPKAEAKPVDRGAANKKKQDKEKVVMEFYMHSSPTALYELISTPSGFAEWYCQDVDVRDDQYTFIFGEEEREETTLIGKKLGEVIRFRRNDEEEYAFFEFRVRIDAMTNEVALVVTDHVLPEEIEATRNLWSAQIHDLMRVLGA